MLRPWRLASCLIALPAAPAYAQNWGGAYGWSCSATIGFDGYEGGVSRSFGSGSENARYILQAQPIGQASRNHNLSWIIDPRAGAVASGGRQWRFEDGRPEADAFRGGPDYVHIDFSWLTEATGPIWAHYWGDGEYAGADMLMSRWNVRRWTDRRGLLGGISGGLSSRPLLAALASARHWSVVVVDGTGKRIFADTFEMPHWQAAETEFRRARAAIDRLEARFRAAHDPISEEGVSCIDVEDPASSI